MSELTRRNFLKGSAGLAGVAAGVALLPDPRRAYGQEIQKEEWVLHWDGKQKRKNQYSGTKFIFIPGLGENWNSTTFDKVKHEVLDQLWFDEHDYLDMAYRIAEGTKLLGVPYSSQDSTQNPQYSLYVMHKMIQKYKQDFSNKGKGIQDKFWIFGFSQGGHLGYELARLHPDVIEGIVTFDSPIKGADIVPSGIDTTLAPLVAPIIGGEASSYYLSRAQDVAIADEVEREVLRMRRRGQTVITLASTNDSVVRDTFAYVTTSDTIAGGRRINGRFAMEEWHEVVTPDYIEEQLTLLDQVLGGNPLYDRNKDEIKRIVMGGHFGHRAVTKNPLLLSELKTALQSKISSLNDPRLLMEQGEHVWRREMRRREDDTIRQEKAVAILIRQKLPYQGSRFTLSYNPLRYELILQIAGDEEDAAIELDRFMKKNMIDLNSHAFNRNLIIQKVS